MAGISKSLKHDLLSADEANRNSRLGMRVVLERKKSAVAKTSKIHHELQNVLYFIGNCVFLERKKNSV